MQLDHNRHYMNKNKDDILAQAEDANVQFIALWFTDITGIVKSIVIPRTELGNVIDNGLHFDGSSIEGFARVVESDMVLVPDLRTFAILPWSRESALTARIICSVHKTNGDPFIGDPRNVLLRALQACEDAGYIFKTGMELEFFLFPIGTDGRPVMATTTDYAGYFDIVDDRVQRINQEMLMTLAAMGIRVDATHSETGSGQHEIGFQYNHALVSADHILTARVALKTVAQQHGMYCTFMPRPLAHMPGSGMHTHQSLHDCHSHTNVFADQEQEYGLSTLAQHFLAGQLEHARAMCAILSPLVNSYKRLGTSFEAPVHITWAHINRGALIRVPSTAPGKEAHTRLELRSPDPSSNPYLATAVMLMAGLDGIKHRTALGQPWEETPLRQQAQQRRMMKTLPKTLDEALDALMEDDVITMALGPYISERYIEAKRQEYDAYKQQVTPWELERYLSRY
jgi:glutamine synthetase